MRWVRFIGIALLAWVAACLLVRRYVCVGWIVPIRVASGSMAPNLLGPHLRLTCPNCAHPVLIDASDPKSIEARHPVRCLNCGGLADTTGASTQTGNRILIDRRAARYGLQRFDMVACQLDGRLIVKRVVGLPEEEVRIVDGDLWLAGNICQKSIDEFISLAILVHADRFRKPDVASRWVADDGSGWSHEGDRHVWQAALGTSADAEAKWLQYEHQGVAVDAAEQHQHPIRDDYQYNAAVSRQLHEVSDLAIACRVSGWQEQLLEFRVGPGGYRIRLEPGQPIQLIVVSDGQSEVVAASKFALAIPADVADLLVGYWDQAIAVRINHDVQWRFGLQHTDFSDSPKDAKPASHLGIACVSTAGQPLTIQELNVWRDIYYFMPQRTSADSILSRPLDEDEYLLIGDNVPRSQDARHGSEFGVVRESQIVGRVSSM